MRTMAPLVSTVDGGPQVDLTVSEISAVASRPSVIATFGNSTKTPPDDGRQRSANGAARRGTTDPGRPTEYGPRERSSRRGSAMRTARPDSSSGRWHGERVGQRIELPPDRPFVARPPLEGGRDNQHRGEDERDWLAGDASFGHGCRRAIVPEHCSCWFKARVFRAERFLPDRRKPHHQLRIVVDRFDAEDGADARLRMAHAHAGPKSHPR